MNSTPPWSRMRCTQPESRTVSPMWLSRKRAAGMGAIAMHGLARDMGHWALQIGRTSACVARPCQAAPSRIKRQSAARAHGDEPCADHRRACRDGGGFHRAALTTSVRVPSATPRPLARPQEPMPRPLPRSGLFTRHSQCRHVGRTDRTGFSDRRSPTGTPNGIPVRRGPASGLNDAMSAGTDRPLVASRAERFGRARIRRT